MGPETLSQRLALCAIYAPYLIIPAAFAFKMAFNPYPDTADKKQS